MALRAPILSFLATLLLPASSIAPTLSGDPGATENLRWGASGHEMAARAAVETLPTGANGIPAFFINAKERLVWLNPEPDRWRDQRRPAMNEGWRYDHYIDLENIPDPAILDDSADRWTFLLRLVAAGVENPQVTVGFAPFAVLELHQRLEASFARWRAERDPVRRRWIEERIIDDAGTLGHYVTDLSQPHHTTIHFNGWDESRVPNPGRYTTDRGFHARFESAFVRTHLRYAEVRGRVGEEARVLGEPREEVIAWVRGTNALVEELYRIDRDHGFGPERPPDPVSVAFAAERVAAGAEMLRDLWWTAWVRSAPD